MTGLPAEETLWTGSPALRNAWPALLAAAVCVLSGPGLYVYGAGLWALAAPAAGGAILGAAWLKLRSVRFVVTSQRVIAARGLLSRERVEVELGDIRQLSLKQTFGQRLLGVGDIEVESSGGPDVEIRIAAVARCADVMETIRQARLASPKGPPPAPIQS